MEPASLGLEGASVVISSRKQVLFPFSSFLSPINYIHYSISLFLQQNVEEAAKKLRAKGIEVLALVCHVSNDQQRKDLIQKIAQCRNIYVIVSTAAANPSVDPILQTKDSALAAEMAPNTRVNCIAPGFVPTNFASFITSYQSLSEYCKISRNMFHSKSLRQDSTSRELLLLQKLEEVGNSVKVENSQLHELQDEEKHKGVLKW
ncbi:hypothetical protein Ahy_B08g092002 [Arachis hypogaea]|uniref:Uncharacterized protein n=1 Tax=Arachis hypogaea TaxID=3818 RepID=A0A444Y2Y0_ARAHY|nr:hypothetical protein Ahy_B08g092002 [Arachis hypogaea]